MADERPSICSHDESVVCHSGSECPVYRERFRHLRLLAFDVIGNLHPDLNGPQREYAHERADVVLAVDRHRPDEMIVLQDHRGTLPVSGQQPKPLNFSRGAGPHGLWDALFHGLRTLELAADETADGLDRAMTEMIVQHPRFASEIQSARQRARQGARKQ